MHLFVTIPAVLAFAVGGAFQSAVEALAILFETVGLLTITSSFPVRHLDSVTVALLDVSLVLTTNTLTNLSTLPG